MAETIWKYPIPHAPFIEHSMPLGAEILSVGSQGGEGVMWAKVNPDNPRVIRRFGMAGTGHDLPFDNSTYIGTFQLPPYVWHVFEVVKGSGE